MYHSVEAEAGLPQFSRVLQPARFPLSGVALRIGICLLGNGDSDIFRRHCFPGARVRNEADHPSDYPDEAMQNSTTGDELVDRALDTQVKEGAESVL